MPATLRIGLGATLSILLAISSAQMKKSDRAEVMLEAARNRARQGDIETAIRQYQEIIATQSANRSVVARALVHVGQCYEKLGGAAARTTYERVVREFSD